MRKFKEKYKFRIMKVQKKMPIYKSPKNEFFVSICILLIIQINKNIQEWLWKQTHMDQKLRIGYCSEENISSFFKLLSSTCSSEHILNHQL